MAAQLPPEVVGVAVGVLVYSLVCLASGFFLLWLVWVHDERKSYVSMLASLMSLHTAASIAQQIHTIVRWRDIKVDQHANMAANVGNPELNITGGSTGLDLVLFYIQYYAYNVESLLVFFWAVELANSIFQIRVKIYRIHASVSAKAFATVLPAVQVVLLRFSAVQRSTVGFMVLADAIMIGCFAAGSILLLGILVRYLHSRFTLASWNVRYGQATSGGTDGTRLSTSNAQHQRLRRAIYDKWLVLRFTVAFLALSLFQIVVINFQLRAASTNTPDSLPAKPDLSVSRARSDFSLFAPGPTAVLFIFVVFGTTRTFREYMWELLVPRTVRDRVEARRQRRSNDKGGVVDVVHSANGGGDIELGNGGAVMGLAVMRGEVDGKSDEWPILKGSVARGR